MLDGICCLCLMFIFVVHTVVRILDAIERDKALLIVLLMKGVYHTCQMFTCNLYVFLCCMHLSYYYINNKNYFYAKSLILIWHRWEDSNLLVEVLETSLALWHKLNFLSIYGASYRIQTYNLLITNQLLSQLS